jgi:hypothetical protein
MGFRATKLKYRVGFGGASHRYKRQGIETLCFRTCKARLLFWQANKGGTAAFRPLIKGWKAFFIYRLKGGIHHGRRLVDVGFRSTP